MEIEIIIRTLRKIHRNYRLTKGTISEHTKSARRITKAWQAAVKSKRILVEVLVSPKNKEKIDVVSASTKTAYELKVSGKNSRHEFCKDIVKVLTYNEYHKARLKKLIFISEPSGINTLEKRLDSQFIDLMKRKHGLELKLIPI